MPYTDPGTVHVPTTGQVAPAAWGTVLRDDLEFLIEPPSCSVYNSTAQSVPSQTTPRTILTANSENYDTDAMHSTVTNNSRITIQTTGLYLLTTTVIFPVGTAANQRGTLDFLIDGATVLFGDVRLLATGGSVTVRASVTRTQRLNAGQYVETAVTHNPGAAANVTLDEFAVFFQGR